MTTNNGLPEESIITNKLWVKYIQDRLTQLVGIKKGPKTDEDRWENMRVTFVDKFGNTRNIWISAIDELHAYQLIFPPETGIAPFNPTLTELE